jgi:hypothetical protein
VIAPFFPENAHKEAQAAQKSAKDIFAPSGIFAATQCSGNPTT